MWVRVGSQCTSVHKYLCTFHNWMELYISAKTITITDNANLQGIYPDYATPIYQQNGICNQNQSCKQNIIHSFTKNYFWSAFDLCIVRQHLAKQTVVKLASVSKGKHLQHQRQEQTKMMNMYYTWQQYILTLHLPKSIYYTSYQIRVVENVMSPKMF